MTRTILWLVGGLCCAVGILSLLFSFEVPLGGDIATSLDRVGWDATGDVTTTPRFVVAMICLAVGVPTLVGLNATAWKQTGGY